MADPTVWTRSVPYVADGDPVKASTPNAPLQVLADRTTALKAIVDSISAGQQLILRSAPVNSDAPVGSVVYLNLETLTQDAALAQWQDLDSDGGRLTPAESSIYTGIVYEKSADTVGDILVTGYAVLDDTGLSNLFGTTDPDVGIYYLSSLSAGTVTNESPAMSVRVLQYAGSGVVRVFAPQNDPVTHTHRNYELYQDEWLDVTFFDSDIVPTGATFGYSFTAESSTDQNLGETLLPSVGEAQYIYLGTSGIYTSSSSVAPTQTAETGKHVDKYLIALDENGIWWYGDAAPGADIEMTVTSADTKGASFIHAIENESTDALTITTQNGRTKIADNEWTTSATDTTGYEVVKDITARSMSKGPVVGALLVGNGLTGTASHETDEGLQGQVSLRLTGDDGVFLTANLMNLNNAVTDVDAPYVFTMFPTGRTSSVTASLTLPNFGTLNYTMVIWAQFISPAAGQAAPTVSDFIITPAPSTDGVTPVTLAATLPAFPTSITSDDLYLVESDEVDVSSYSKGTVFFTLEAASPSTDLKMVNMGVRLIVSDS